MRRKLSSQRKCGDGLERAIPEQDDGRTTDRVPLRREFNRDEQRAKPCLRIESCRALKRKTLHEMRDLRQANQLQGVAQS